jgi:hypothetical protein
MSPTGKSHIYYLARPVDTIAVARKPAEEQE